jgi:hypothetical protein
MYHHHHHHHKRKNPRAVKSGKQGGQVIGLHLPMHLPRNLLFKTYITSFWKCGGAQSCWTGMSSASSSISQYTASHGMFGRENNPKTLFVWTKHKTHSTLDCLLYIQLLHKSCSELLGFWTSSIVQYSKKIENTTFRKLDLFLSSGEGAGNTWVR